MVSAFDRDKKNQLDKRPLPCHSQRKARYATELT